MCYLWFSESNFRAFSKLHFKNLFFPLGLRQADVINFLLRVISLFLFLSVSFSFTLSLSLYLSSWHWLLGDNFTVIHYGNVEWLYLHLAMLLLSFWLWFQIVYMTYTEVSLYFPPVLIYSHAYSI
jgi:hypothetical protein